MSVEFVDTNIFVYAHDAASPQKRAQALELIGRLSAGRNGRVSTQVLLEFFAASRKIGLQRAVAAEIVEDLISWPVYAPDVDDITMAIALSIRQTISVWDALMIRSALQSGCDILWSEDMQDRRRFGSLRVRNPFRA
jgi:predicted nucleic acid-binding protein